MNHHGDRQFFYFGAGLCALAVAILIYALLYNPAQFVPAAPICVAPTFTPTASPTIQVIHPPTVTNPLPIPDTLTPTLAPTQTNTPAPTLTNSPSLTPTATRIPAGRDGTPVPLPTTGMDYQYPQGLLVLIGALLIAAGLFLMERVTKQNAS